MAEVVGAILLAVITLYAIFGGADFGGGFWDLVAGGDRRGRAPRDLIDEAITPVWETNHMWLIFALVIFWTAFPDAFASVMTAAALPIWLAVLGIVLRGAGFAFRAEARRLSAQRALGATFALSSLLTPFFMGTVIGGIAAGQIPADATSASRSSWTGTTSLLTGLLFVGACAYLAAVYLIGEAARRDDHHLEVYFTRRAQASGVVTGALSFATLLALHSSNPTLFDRLTGRAFPLVIVGEAAGLGVLAFLLTGRRRGLRVLAALGVAAVLWGWGVAQYPTLLPGTGITLTNAGAPHATLVALVVLFGVVVLLVAPSVLLLFSLQGRRRLVGGDAEGTVLAPWPLPGTLPLSGTPLSGAQPLEGSVRSQRASSDRTDAGGRAAPVVLLVVLLVVGALVSAVTRLARRVGPVAARRRT
jgi:cytochrome d ubiquinol oxidase subunit II